MADTQNAENNEEKTGVQHFDGTVSKIDSEGRLVASSYVDYDNGEKLAGDAEEDEVTEAQAETAKQADAELKESEAAQAGDSAKTEDAAAKSSGGTTTKASGGTTDSGTTSGSK